MLWSRSSVRIRPSQWPSRLHTASGHRSSTHIVNTGGLVRDEEWFRPSLLRDTFAARLARAFAPGDYVVVFADRDQPSLFMPPIATIHSVVTKPCTHEA